MSNGPTGAGPTGGPNGVTGRPNGVTGRPNGVTGGSTGGPRAEPRTRIWHPLLFAVWPALDLWAGNTSEVLATDALLAAGVLALGAYAFYRLLRLLFRDGPRAGVVASLCVVAFFSYSAVHGLAAEANARLGWTFLSGNANPLRHRYLIGLLALLLGGAGVWLWRSRRDFAPATRVVNMIALTLVVLTAGRIATATMTQPGAGGAPAEGLAVAGEATGAKPDIYYVVLDRYANSETLADAYDYDNAPFLESLRERGFAVSPDLRCNYARTTFSFSSALNMEYFGKSIHKSKVVSRMRRGHRVGEFLRSQGYEYLHLGSWWTPTAACKIADRNISHPAARTSEFPIALMKMTPLMGLPVFNGYEFHIHGETAQFQFDKLTELARAPGTKPRLVVAHILMPHPPFVFDRHGNKIKLGQVSTYGQASKHNYLEHLRYTNTRMTEVVDAILEHRTRPAVIILQGDEGPFLRGEDKDADRMAQIRIRTGVLSAVYVSDAEAAASFETAQTPINTFRIILNRYFGADLEMLGEKVFSWKGMLRPIEPDCKGVHEFEDITEKVLN